MQIMKNRKTREILQAIEDIGGTYPAITKLAEHVGLSADQTKRRLDTLVEQGLVTMELRTKEDRQWYLIGLTPEGKERLRELPYERPIF